MDLVDWEFWSTQAHLSLKLNMKRRIGLKHLKTCLNSMKLPLNMACFIVFVGASNMTNIYEWTSQNFPFVYFWKLPTCTLGEASRLDFVPLNSWNTTWRWPPFSWTEITYQGGRRWKRATQRPMLEDVEWVWLGSKNISLHTNYSNNM